MTSSSGSECGTVTIYFRAGNEHTGHKPVFFSAVTANLLRATVLGGISYFY